MPLITIIVVLVVVGVALWAINTYITMAKPVKTILNIVVVVVLCLWLLQLFGVIDSIKSIRHRVVLIGILPFTPASSYDIYADATAGTFAGAVVVL